MSKTLLILAAGVIAALLLGGAVEVKIHPEKLASVPAAIAKSAKEGGLLTATKTKATISKRTVEQYVLDSEKQKFEVALQYVKEDSEKLNKLIEGEGSWDSDKVVTQATLLEDSLERIDEQSQEVPMDTLAEFKDKSEESLKTAQATLAKLEEFQNEYEDAKEKLASITQTLKDQLEKFDLTPEDADIAGAQDEAEENQESEPTDIPLKF